jgi:ribosomal protein S18 acetylase RimI-like enzyme
MSIQSIRKATTADVNHLVSHLVRAFDNDPFFNWVIRQDSKRLFGFELLFRTCLSTLSLPHGEVLTTDDCIGGALWYPPGTSKVGFVQQLSFLPKIIRAATLRGVKRFIDMMDALDKIHPIDRHYYLQIVGVDPDHHGKGLGTALLRPVLDRCDQEGCGAYLENTNEVNFTLYERLGFEIVDEFYVCPGAPPIYPMWRNAKKSS